MRIIGNRGNTDRKVQAVASGALASGDTVIVNSDGTVSVVSGSSQTEAVGTPTVFETSSQSEIENQASAYDSANGRVIIAYKGSSAYGTAIVGTVSGTSISFGTAVVFNSNTTNYISIDYDSNTGKVLIAYLNNSNNDGEAIVGTVSNTAISFGSASAFYTGGGQAQRIGCIYSSQDQKFGIFYGDSAGGSYPPSGQRVVATISGTSVSFGSASTWYSTREVNLQKTCYDSTNNRFVTVFKAGTGISYTIAHSMSGTSFSTALGPTIIYDSSDTTEYSDIQQFAIAHDSDTGANLWIFRGALDSGANDYQAKVIKISGGSFSIGSKTQIQTQVTTYNGITYDSTAQKFVLAYISPDQGAGVYYRTATVSGTTPTFSDAVEFETGEGRSGTSVTSLGNGTVVMSYVDDDNSDRGTSAVLQIGYLNTNLTSENFIGIASNGYASGQAATINAKGFVDDNQSSLTAGQSYFVQTNGDLGTTAADPSVFAGTAVSATKLIVKG